MTQMTTISDVETKSKPCKRETKQRKSARPIKRILDKASGDVVGWLYEWNTGHVVPMWKAEPFEDVFYR
jgi:hypothetical protein